VAPHIDVPQPSIARLSAQGNTVYVVGVQSVFRYHWNDATQSLQLDADWRYDYLKDAPQSYGWDLVLDGEAAWFMDNGAHNYKLACWGQGSTSLKTDCTACLCTIPLVLKLGQSVAYRAVPSPTRP
jgi:hypothetical protein